MCVFIMLYTPLPPSVLLRAPPCSSVLSVVFRIHQQFWQIKFAFICVHLRLIFNPPPFHSILHILKYRAGNDENEDVKKLAARMMLHYNI